MRHIEFFDENSILINALKDAWNLVNDIDQKDMLLVTPTLEVEGLIWTGDTKLRKGLQNKGFDPFYILK